MAPPQSWSPTTVFDFDARKDVQGRTWKGIPVHLQTPEIVLRLLGEVAGPAVRLTVTSE